MGMGTHGGRKALLAHIVALAWAWGCTGADSPAAEGPSPGAGATVGPAMAGAAPTDPPLPGSTTPPLAPATDTNGADSAAAAGNADTAVTTNPGPPTPTGAAGAAPAEDPTANMDMQVQEAPGQANDGSAMASEPSAGCGQGDVPEAGEKTIDVGGTERTYIVGLPANYDAQHPYRLVFAWHGLGGTATMIARSWYGLPAYANDSAIYIAGQAQMGTGRQGGLASWAIQPDDSDMDYTRAMLEWAESNYCIDQARVFSVGMSNGGMMSNIVGCELGEEFRAIAAMSGGGPRGYATTPCKGQVAVWISHGNRDNNVPFSYGEMSRDYWSAQNGCSDESTQAMPELCVEYQGCEEGLPVQFCEFDGGHTIPEYSAEAVWRFFERF